MRDLYESSAPTITFSQAREEGACAESYRRMARHLGGVKAYGRDRPIPVEQVLDVCGLADALWALSAIGARRVLHLWACDCAERVLPIFEACCPDDRRPREAIRVSRLYASGLASEREMADATHAAIIAADAAEDVAASAWHAARAAVRCAEAEWADAELAVSCAADCAAWHAADCATTATDRDAEHAWQVERLRAYLRGEAE